MHRLGAHFAVLSTAQALLLLLLPSELFPPAPLPLPSRILSPPHFSQSLTLPRRQLLQLLRRLHCQQLLLLVLLFLRFRLLLLLLLLLFGQAVHVVNIAREMGDPIAEITHASLRLR